MHMQYLTRYRALLGFESFESISNKVFGHLFEHLSRATDLLQTAPRRTRKHLNMGRGALIVLEGCDRAGKSSQSKLLLQALHFRGISAVSHCFPDRKTKIGSLIDEYLSNKEELAPETVHLLFSANRWERQEYISKVIESGVTIILDRYAASGAAYTAATTGRDLAWCKEPDRGLPAPDLVVYLNVSEEFQKQRSNWGEERFEKQETQKKVAKNFEMLRDKSWVTVNANLLIPEIHELVLKEVLKTIKNVENKPLRELYRS